MELQAIMVRTGTTLTLKVAEPKVAPSLMVLGRVPKVQDAEICCGLLLNICESYCSYHCIIYIIKKVLFGLNV